MNPDKLFDYLDGKLSPADRDALENKLIDDPQLQRQFAIAREIHRGGRVSREMTLPVDDPALIQRGGRLGRQIATAAIALVLLNVLIGISVITVKNRKPAPSGASEAAVREQIAASLGAAAQDALPVPIFASAEIHLAAPREEWDGISSKIIAAAENCAGSAAKGLPDEAGLLVVADVPTGREAEFRRLVQPAASAPPIGDPPASRPNERIIVQVRIAEAGQ